MKFKKYCFFLLLGILSCNNPKSEIYTEESVASVISKLDASDSKAFTTAVNLLDKTELEGKTISEIIKNFENLEQQALKQANDIKNIYPTLFLYRNNDASIQGKFTQIVSNEPINYVMDLDIVSEFIQYESEPIVMVDVLNKQSETKDEVRVYAYKTLFNYKLKPENGKEVIGKLLGYRFINKRGNSTVVSNSGYGINEFIYIPGIGNDEAKNRFIKSWTDGTRLVNGPDNNKKFVSYCQDALKTVGII